MAKVINPDKLRKQLTKVYGGYHKAVDFVMIATTEEISPKAIAGMYDLIDQSIALVISEDGGVPYFRGAVFNDVAPWTEEQLLGFIKYSKFAHVAAPIFRRKDVSLELMQAMIKILTDMQNGDVNSMSVIIKEFLEEGPTNRKYDALYNAKTHYLESLLAPKSKKKK